MVLSEQPIKQEKVSIMDELRRLIDSIVAAHDDIRIAIEANAQDPDVYGEDVVTAAKAKYEAAEDAMFSYFADSANM